MYFVSSVRKTLPRESGLYRLILRPLWGSQSLLKVGSAPPVARWEPSVCRWVVTNRLTARSTALNGALNFINFNTLYHTVTFNFQLNKLLNQFPSEISWGVLGQADVLENMLQQTFMIHSFGKNDFWAVQNWNSKSYHTFLLKFFYSKIKTVRYSGLADLIWRGIWGRIMWWRKFNLI